MNSVTETNKASFTPVMPYRPPMSRTCEITLDGIDFKALIFYTHDKDFNEYKVTKVEVEFVENMWADLQPEHYHVIEQMLETAELWQ